jgi:hypothetical protein
MGTREFKKGFISETFFALSLWPCAMRLSYMPQACREPQGRTREAIEGNVADLSRRSFQAKADDTLMVDQGKSFSIDK